MIEDREVLSLIIPIIDDEKFKPKQDMKLVMYDIQPVLDRLRKKYGTLVP